MARRRRVPQGARPTTLLFTPEEELALQVIELRRRKRSEERDSLSEIVSDALWKFLVEVEGVSRKEIEALLPSDKVDVQESNVKIFPNNPNK